MSRQSIYNYKRYNEILKKKRRKANKLARKMRRINRGE